MNFLNNLFATDYAKQARKDAKAALDPESIANYLLEISNCPAINPLKQKYSRKQALKCLTDLEEFIDPNQELTLSELANQTYNNTVEFHTQEILTKINQSRDVSEFLNQYLNVDEQGNVDDYSEEEIVESLIQEIHNIIERY